MNPRTAIPIQVPRIAYVAASLAIVACGLVVMRYGPEGRLDLRAPMPGMFQHMLIAARTEAAKLEKEIERRMPDRREEKNGAKDQDASQPADATPDNPDASGEKASADKAKQDAAGKKENGKTQTASDRERAGSQSEQVPSEQSQESNGQNASATQSNSGSEQQQYRSGDAPARFDGESGSLGAKLSNSVQNLLSALKPRQPGDGRSQSSNARNPSQRSEQQGRDRDGQSDSGSQRDQQASGEGTGENGGQTQNSPSNGNGKGAGEKAEKKPGSGAGKEDGDKTIKSAEQLEAMGKISVLLGKRSENVTGDSAIEVQSGSQQLRTQYVQKDAAHASVESAANRDEVPLALESYVEHYFEQIRKNHQPLPSSAARRGSAVHGK